MPIFIHLSSKFDIILQNHENFQVILLLNTFIKYLIFNFYSYGLTQ